MTELANPFLPAIQALEAEYDALVRNANAMLPSLNFLREKAGLPPKSPGFAGAGAEAAGGAAAIPVQIKSDTFYGKRMQTAVREYLEMRRAQGDGPATPRQIYEAITAGGFKFETTNETTALVGLRALLRKRTAFFHKLPNGTYGLTGWYEHVRPAKTISGAKAGFGPDDIEDDEDDETETAAAQEGPDDAAVA